MAALSSIAIAGLAIAGAGTALSYQQGRASQRSARRAEDQQEQIRGEQAASNASQAAAERRQQARQERQRRAQILNASANSGTAGSSGELGAIGSLSSQLATNLGSNQGAIMRGERISAFSQNAANFMGRSQAQANRSGIYGQIGGLGGNIFNSAGGWQSIF